MKNICIEVTTAIIVIVTAIIYITDLDYSRLGIKSILRDPYQSAIVANENLGDYFIYHDKIYYVEKSKDTESDESYILYSMDFYGKHNREIIVSDKLRNAEFCFVYNNCAYFTNPDNDIIRKADLEERTVIDIGSSSDLGEYIPGTFDHGMIYTIYNDLNGSGSILRVIDLENDEIVKETVTDRYAWRYFINTENSDLYYITKPKEGEVLSNVSIYRNNDHIFDISVMEKDDTSIIACNNRYLYVEKLGHIHKIDVEQGIYLGEINTNDDGFNKSRIIGSNNTDNYFYDENGIYTFDTDSSNFGQITGPIYVTPQCIYNTKSKSVFIAIDQENMNCNGWVIVYNKLANDIEEYNYVKDAFVDEKKLYMLCCNGRYFAVRTCELAE